MSCFLRLDCGVTWTPEFFGLDKAVLRKALGVLQSEGKAELFTDDDDPDSDGVKFF